MDDIRRDAADPRDPDAQRQLLADAMRRRERHDLDGFLRLFTPDCEIEFPGVVVRGLDDWRAFQRTWLDAFPDGAYEVVRNEPAGDTVFVEGVWSGTHTGPLTTPEGELPATGRRVAIRFVVVAGLRDGRIAAIRNYHDRLDFLSQLGLLPAPVR